MLRKLWFARSFCPEEQAAAPEKRRHSWRLFLLNAFVSAFITLLATYIFSIRPWHRRWGATDDEARRWLPGDDLIASPKFSATHAITINAHAADIWPWLVQLGWGRGGFYSYTWIENQMAKGYRNADRILPDFQHLAVGDTIPLAPAGNTVIGFPVAVLEPEYALVLHGDTRAAKPGDPALVRPGDFMAVTWGFYLDEYPDGTTRLIERFRLDFNRSPWNTFFYRVFMEPGSFIMERKMLLNIRHLVEARSQPQPAHDGRLAV